MERLFHLRAANARVRTEILGGITTFLTMAYIIVVNPAILTAAGIPAGPSTIATILTAAFGTILMGLWANRPIGVAPYMGENAFIAFGLATLGIGWQLRIGAVFVSGVIFLIVTVLKVRGWLANSISPTMKYSFAIGVGFLLALVGLNDAGIIRSYAIGKPPFALFPPMIPCDCTTPIPSSGIPVPIEIGSLTQGPVLLAIAGIVFMAVLMVRRVPGALLVGIVITALAGIILGFGKAPEGILALPKWSGPDGLSAIAGKLRFSETLPDGRTASLFSMTLLPVLLTLFLMDFLDTLGTLMGVGAAGNMLDEKGNFPNIERPMLVDATACIFSALVGTSTSGAYIESAAGIKDGARTGLAAVTTGVLFLLCLFFVPLVVALTELRFAYGPALVVVGMLMMPSFRLMKIEDLTEFLPAFLTIVLMALTFNPANGLTAGLAAYPLIKVFSGRHKELNAGMLVLGALCLLYYIAGIVH
ncbi:MAG: NCS2 family permease [Candidatus Eisenbacteria bacterium]|nr:NCS2 family permease [Candidatus Eisenbacteria bacterium]